MLHDEHVMTFTEAAKTLPKINGRTPHCSTIWRWARRGLGGVHLETRKIGGRFVTSKEALERFTKQLAEMPIATIQTTPAPPPPVPRKRTPAQRQRDIAAAEAALAKAGI